MRSRVFLFMTLMACILTTRTHAERVACTTALADIFAEVHGEPSEQTPAPFEQKKEAFLSIYRAATEGLSIEELQGLARQPFDFVDFVDATNLARSHEKLMQLKKILPSFSAEERSDLILAIQTFLSEKTSNAQMSQERWIKKQDEQKDAKLVQFLRGHSFHVHSLAFSPDGTRLASVCGSKNILVWDLKSPAAAPITLTGHSEYVRSVAISPDGKRLVSGCSDGAIRIWQLDNPTSATTPVKGPDFENSVDFVAFSPDGKLVTAGGEDGIIRIWQLDNPKGTSIDLEARGTAFTNAVVAFSPDSKALSVGARDGSIRICNQKMQKSGRKNRWSLRNKQRQPNLKNLNYLTLSPDLKLFASKGDGDTIRIWDANLPTSGPIILKGEVSSNVIFAFSPDGKFFASGGYDGAIRIWNLESLTTTPSIFKGHTNYVVFVAFSPDGKTLVSSGWDKTIRVWSFRRMLDVGSDHLEEDVQ